MASEDTVRAIFGLFEDAGLKPPGAWASPERAKSGLKVYEVILSGASDTEAMMAALSYLESPDAKWWPTPGVLKSHIPSVAMSELDDADIAWGDLLSSISAHGYVDPPGKTWDLDPDPVRNQAMHAGLLAVGGWRTLCTSEEGTSAASRASFRAAYRTASTRTRIESKQMDATRMLGIAVPKMIGE